MAAEYDQRANGYEGAVTARQEKYEIERALELEKLHRDHFEWEVVVAEGMFANKDGDILGAAQKFMADEEGRATRFKGLGGVVPGVKYHYYDDGGRTPQGEQRLLREMYLPKGFPGNENKKD